jgi:hypothetical protein
MNCPFKIGEKIVCINKSWSSSPYTIGKTYIVQDGYRYITIKGDHGSSFVPNWNEFITIKKYRKLKLNKLNEK